MKLRVTCGALTRMEYTCVIEVPDNTPKENFDEIARRIYEETEAEDFKEDKWFWERGECHAEKVGKDVPVTREFVPNEDDDDLDADD